MDAVPTLVRTTVFTTIGSILVYVLLRHRNTSSPVRHRIAAVMVLLQGWAVIPIAVHLANLPAERRVTNVTAKDELIHSTAPTAIAADALAKATPPAEFRPMFWLAAAWMIGMFAVVARFGCCYLKFVRRLPLGSSPSNEAWISEWSHVTRDVSPKTKAQFRITDGVGPLVCFVPFSYLILAPEKLWTSLDALKRTAILRHELAHIVRRDLWKSLAIRVLALPQWFNPFAWYAVRVFDEAAEWACDDLVSAKYHSDTDYASALLQIAESRLPTAMFPIPNSASVGGGDLGVRVRRLVQPRFMEESIMKSSVLYVVLIAMALIQTVRVERVAAADPVGPIPPAAIGENGDAPLRFTAERKKDLIAAGLLPYRVDSPDIIWISTPDDTANTDANYEGLNAEYIVDPDGLIHLKGIGQVSVRGLTTIEIQKAIQRKLNPATSPFNVEVGKKNSKVIYVIFRGNLNGDYAIRIPCDPTSNVRQVLSTQIRFKATFDPDKSTIWVSRPRANGNDESVHPIDWTESDQQENARSNFALLPNDRIFVDSTENVAKKKKTQQVVSKFPVGKKPQQVLPSAYYEIENSHADQKIRLDFRFISDKLGNLSEFEAIKKTGVMVANAKQTETTLKILEKNKLITTLAMPTVTCRSKQRATVAVDNVEIDSVATALTESKLLIETRIKTQMPAAPVIDSAFEVRVGDALLLKANSKSSELFVLVTATLQE